MQKSLKGAARPQITMTAMDHQRLARLADAASATMPEAAACLADELDRALIMPEDRSPDAVRMGGEVEFRDDMTGRVQTVTLVYPEEADISKGRISVLTPIGTALIGLSAGQSITWETRNGDERMLTVLAVRRAADAA